MATLIEPNGHMNSVRPENGKKFTIAELQKYVGGDIELVPTRTRRNMYVNEEGLLLGLPYNQVATELMTTNFLRAGNIIVGPAIVMDKGEG